MERNMPRFEEVVAFHGHACLELAIGYRAARATLQAFSVERPVDETCGHCRE